MNPALLGGGEGQSQSSVISPSPSWNQTLFGVRTVRAYIGEPQNFYPYNVRLTPAVGDPTIYEIPRVQVGYDSGSSFRAPVLKFNFYEFAIGTRIDPNSNHLSFGGKRWEYIWTSPDQKSMHLSNSYGEEWDLKSGYRLGSHGSDDYYWIPRFLKADNSESLRYGVENTDAKYLWLVSDDHFVGSKFKLDTPLEFSFPGFIDGSIKIELVNTERTKLGIKFENAQIDVGKLSGTQYWYTANTQLSLSAGDGKFMVGTKMIDARDLYIDMENRKAIYRTNSPYAYQVDLAEIKFIPSDGSDPLSISINKTGSYSGNLLFTERARRAGEGFRQEFVSSRLDFKKSYAGEYSFAKNKYDYFSMYASSTLYPIIPQEKPFTSYGYPYVSERGTNFVSCSEKYAEIEYCNKIAEVQYSLISGRAQLAEKVPFEITGTGSISAYLDNEPYYARIRAATADCAIFHLNSPLGSHYDSTNRRVSNGANAFGVEIQFPKPVKDMAKGEKFTFLGREWEIQFPLDTNSPFPRIVITDGKTSLSLADRQPLLQGNANLHVSFFDNDLVGALHSIHGDGSYPKGSPNSVYIVDRNFEGLLGVGEGMELPEQLGAKLSFGELERNATTPISVEAQKRTFMNVTHHYFKNEFAGWAEKNISALTGNVFSLGTSGSYKMFLSGQQVSEAYLCPERNTLIVRYGQEMGYHERPADIGLIVARDAHYDKEPFMVGLNVKNGEQHIAFVEMARPNAAEFYSPACYTYVPYEFDNSGMPVFAAYALFNRNYGRRETVLLPSRAAELEVAVPNYVSSRGSNINSAITETGFTFNYSAQIALAPLSVQLQMGKIPSSTAAKIEGVEFRQNYPNPFNASTVLEYDLKNASSCRLAVNDLTGREVAVLVDQQQLPGTYKLQFNAGDLPSGTYIAILTADGKSLSKTMTITK